MVSSPARTGARPNLRRRIFRTTLLGLASSAAASASVGGGTMWGPLASPSMMVPGWASATASSVSSALCWRRLVSSQSVGRLSSMTISGSSVQAGAVVDLGVDEGERDLGHAGGLAVAGAGEDDVFHLDAAEGFGGLFAEDPGDGVGDVGFAAAVGADDGGDAFAGELNLGAITEGFEAEYLNFLELEQVRPLWGGGLGEASPLSDYDWINFSCGSGAESTGTTPPVVDKKDITLSMGKLSRDPASWYLGLSTARGSGRTLSTGRICAKS